MNDAIVPPYICKSLDYRCLGLNKSRDVKRRLSVLMDLWNAIIEMWDRGKRLTREDIIGLLKEAYQREKLSPLRGASMPKDIYDKELTSLYIVGKYGMGLEDQYPELFDQIFSKEIRYEHAIEALLTLNPESSREKVKLLLGDLNDNTIARMLRLKLVEAYFGFSTYESLISLMKNLAKTFPEKMDLLSKYARFYVAFRVAENIHKGEIKDRIVKEAMKQALALELGSIRNAIPDDEYIGKIASEVFKVSNKTLQNILYIKKKSRSSKTKTKA